MAAPVPEPEPELSQLPPVVRDRVVALTAGVLPDVPQLPAAVRRVATFAPARRARLGGTAILEALADDDVRARVGTQVGARNPEGDDPATAAALAWLTRPEGWGETLAEGVRRLAEREAPGDRADRELERLRGRLAAAEQSVRDLRAAHRAQLDELRVENTALRRRLGDTRAAERTARAVADEAAAALEAVRAEAAETVAGLEKDNRRLRAAVERLEAAEARQRREGRADRDEATLRARVLLETVIDAAAGLRRELALPPVSGAPADRIEAALEDQPRPGPSAPAGGASPAMVEQWLAMPRARLLLDGYNVSKTVWPSSSLEAQRVRLMGAVAPLVARTGAETTIVFDAAESEHRPPVSAPRGVRVLFSPRGVIADDVLRDLVAAEPPGRVVVVVTADRAVATDVTRTGARVVPPDTFLTLLTR